MSVVTLSLIAAMDRQRVIGIENRLPWYLPADLKRFKQITLGKPVIMGRNTYESIGRSLPGRRNIIVTRTVGYAPAGCEIAGSLADALQQAGAASEVMLIGGASLYQQALPQVQRMYLTMIDADYPGDAWFPAYAETDWNVCAVEHIEKSETFAHAYRFMTLERRQT